jgi:HPr kinase/phosphorylase
MSSFEIIEEFDLEKVYMPEGGEARIIKSADVNRPGIQLSGYFGHFESTRINLFGNVEYDFMESYTSENRFEAFSKLFKHDIPALVMTRSLEVYPEMMKAAQISGVPILRTSMATSYFAAALIASLNLHLAQRITRHGVLVEVYGEGILILGDSGIGKSETAIELVKRGHRLIADDAVEIKKVSAKTLVGTAPDIIRHYIEIRGIGVVDVRRLFGMGSVKISEKIELIVNLEQWDENKFYDRMGLDNETMNILGVDIPLLTVPVRPGRNLALIIEVAAMNNRQKLMGHNAAKELNDKIMKTMLDNQKISQQPMEGM